MKKKINRVLSLILTLALVFSMGVPAFATEAEGDNEAELTGTVTHVVSGDCVIETITLFDSDGNSVVIEKKVYAYGEMEVFNNNTLVRIESNVDFERYLAVAEGRYMTTSHAPAGARAVAATNPCGFDDVHTLYGPLTEYTVDITGTVAGLSVAALICSGLRIPVVPAVLGAIAGMLPAALDGGARYVDVTAYDFLIEPEGYPTALICTHVMFRYYDIKNGREVLVENDWKYYQTNL